MTNVQRAEELAEKLRQEDFSFMRNSCIRKSIRLKRQLKGHGVSSRILFCIGTAKANWFGHLILTPSVHTYLDVDGTRIETARQPEDFDVWHITPANIKPYFGIWF